MAQAALLLGVSTRTLHRHRSDGLDAWTANHLAISTGWHPLLIWKQAWIDAVSRDQAVVVGDQHPPYALPSASP